MAKGVQILSAPAERNVQKVPELESRARSSAFIGAKRKPLTEAVPEAKKNSSLPTR